jgi:hypothetical protein
MQEKASEFFPIVGYRYRSPAVVTEDTVPPDGEIALLDRQELTGVPGTRVPHIWLERRRQRVSTLDLLNGRFVLLAGGGGRSWCQAAAQVATSLGIDVDAYRVAPDGDLLDSQNEWSQKMGVSADGAVLVRPDGFVAWRSGRLATTPEQSLENALLHVLCRSRNIYEPHTLPGKHLLR